MPSHAPPARRLRPWLIVAALLGLLGAVALAYVAGKGLFSAVPPASNSGNELRTQVEPAWVFEQVERGAIVSSPRIVGDRVYVGAIRDVGLSTSGVVYCLDRETGRKVWAFDDDGAMQHMFSSSCVADGRLYIGEGMHANHVCKFYCLDAATGRKLWDFETAGHIESSPCVADGWVFFGSGDDGLYALDAATGRKLWHFEGPLHIDTSPTVVAGRLYCGSGVSRTRKATEVFCLDAADGQVLWRQPTDLPAWGSPAVDGDRVFVGLGNGRLVRDAEPPEKPAGALWCLDAATGKPGWRFDVPNGVLARPAVDAERVYFGARDGYCYAIDRRDGRLCWRESLGSPVVTSPALAGGYIFVAGADGRVARLAKVTGRAEWVFDVAGHYQTHPRLFSSPAVVAEGDGRHRIYLGAELRMPASSAAVLLCLRD